MFSRGLAAFLASTSQSPATTSHGAFRPVWPAVCRYLNRQWSKLPGPVRADPTDLQGPCRWTTDGVSRPARNALKVTPPLPKALLDVSYRRPGRRKSPIYCALVCQPAWRTTLCTYCTLAELNRVINLLFSSLKLERADVRLSVENKSVN